MKWLGGQPRKFKMTTVLEKAFMPLDSKLDFMAWLTFQHFSRYQKVFFVITQKHGEKAKQKYAANRHTMRTPFCTVRLCAKYISIHHLFFDLVTFFLWKRFKNFKLFPQKKTKYFCGYFVMLLSINAKYFLVVTEMLKI